jgi:hypothetical protein
MIASKATDPNKPTASILCTITPPSYHQFKKRARVANNKMSRYSIRRYLKILGARINRRVRYCGQLTAPGKPRAYPARTFLVIVSGTRISARSTFLAEHRQRHRIKEGTWPACKQVKVRVVAEFSSKTVRSFELSM